MVPCGLAIIRIAGRSRRRGSHAPAGAVSSRQVRNARSIASISMRSLSEARHPRARTEGTVRRPWPCKDAWSLKEAGSRSSVWAIAGA